MLGCCIPRDPSKHTNKMINEALERERKELSTESKLLLLGKIVWNQIPYMLLRLLQVLTPIGACITIDYLIIVIISLNSYVFFSVSFSSGAGESGKSTVLKQMK